MKQKIWPILILILIIVVVLSISRFESDNSLDSLPTTESSSSPMEEEQEDLKPLAKSETPKRSDTPVTRSAKPRVDDSSDSKQLPRRKKSPNEQPFIEDPLPSNPSVDIDDEYLIEHPTDRKIHLFPSKEKAKAYFRDILEDSLGTVIGDDILEQYFDRSLSKGELTLPAIDRKQVLAKMVFHIPDTMTVGIRYTAKVSLTKSHDHLIMQQGFTKNEISDLTFIDSLKLASNIMVSLKDPSDGRNFSISSLCNETQIITSGNNTMWKWSVIPITTGTNQLEIIVSNVFSDDSGQQDIIEPAFERSINVESNYLYNSKTFWEKYWQWVIGTFLLPFVLWLSNLLFKRFAANNKKATNTPAGFKIYNFKTGK